MRHRYIYNMCLIPRTYTFFLFWLLFFLKIEQVGNALGDQYFQLLEQFHHIIFFGDLNCELL